MSGPRSGHSSSAGGQRERALDTEWSESKRQGMRRSTFVRQLDSLDAWLRQRLHEELRKPPAEENLDTLAQIRTQILSLTPTGAERPHAHSRRVAADGAFSIEDRICAMAAYYPFM